MHIFTGQHSHASALVLCVGDDGHVAIEAVQHQAHTGHLEDVSEHAKICSDAGECRDISLSLGHSELVISSINQDVLHQLRDASLNITWLHTVDFPVFKPHDIESFTYLEHHDRSAQIQTLKHTILTI